MQDIETADAQAAEISDEALMALYAQGQVWAFNNLYQRYKTSLWRYIYHSIQNQATADELMQDTWFAIARAASSYAANQHGAAFKTWAFTVAHHKMVDHWRKAHTKAKTVSLDAEDNASVQAAAQLFANSAFGPLRQIESHEQAKTLIAAVDSLPPAQREAFLLQAEGDMTVEDIAKTIGVSFETAKSRLRYARSKLKALLADFEEATT